MRNPIVGIRTLDPPLLPKQRLRRQLIMGCVCTDMYGDNPFCTFSLKYLNGVFYPFRFIVVKLQSKIIRLQFPNSWVGYVRLFATRSAQDSLTLV